MANTSSDRDKTVVLRKLGINETYQLAMYLLNQYRGTILSCRYTIPERLAPAESQSQLEEVLKVAVVETIMRHPMMQISMIEANTKTPSWIQLQSLDLTQHIKWHYVGEHDNFEAIVQEIIRVQLDDHFPDLSTRQPGWKITIIRQGYAPTMEVLLTWNHPHFDGTGARVIHEDLLDMLNMSREGVQERLSLHGSIFTLPQTPPVLPVPIEDLKSLPLDVMFFVKVLWEEFRPSFLNRDISLARWCPIRTSPYKTQYRAFFIDHQNLVAILALCRRNKTSITGLINALALVTFSLRLASKDALAFQSATMVDHRRNLPPAPSGAPWAHSDRTVGNYVTQLLHTYGKDVVARVRSKLSPDANGRAELSTDLKEEVWAVAAQNKLEITNKLKEGVRNDIVGIFKWVTDWQKTMSDMAKKTRQFTWLVTNLGVLDGTTSGPRTSTVPSLSPARDDARLNDGQRWTISRAQFGLSAEIPAAAIEFAQASVTGGGMYVSANWADCALDVHLGERIMADMEQWLTQLATQP